MPERSSTTNQHYVAPEVDVVNAFMLRGWRKEIRAGGADQVRAEVQASLDRFCAAGLPFEVVGTQRMFDPIALNFVTQIGLDGTDPFFRDRVVAPIRATASRFAPRTVPAARYHDPRRVTVDFRREISYVDKAPGSRVIVSLPMPVEEPTQRDVVVTPTPMSTGSVSVENGMLIARTTVPQDRRVRLGARIELTGYQQTLQIDRAAVQRTNDPSLSQYLAPSEGIIQVSPSVEVIARRLVRDNTWDSLLAFWDFFFDEKKMGSVYHHALDPEDPLGKVGEWVDCYVGSALFIALARASGIPARMVHGALLYPDTDAGLHYWSEAFVAPYGWVPFDLHGWLLAGGDKRDEHWSRFLVGHLPYQMVLLRLPRTRLELGLRYPRRWFGLSKVEGRGQRNTVFDLDTGAPAVEDYLEVEIGDAP